MSTINELKYAALLDVTGATPPITMNELELLRLEQLGYSGSLNEGYHKFFDDENVPKGTFNERLSNYLESRGFTGTLNEKLIQWYTGGAEISFCINSTGFNPLTSNVFVVFTQAPTTVDAVGWSCTVDGVTQVMTFSSQDGRIAYYTLPVTLTVSSVVLISYSGAGNTEYQGEQCCPVVDSEARPVSTNIVGISSSYGLYSQNVVTEGDENYILKRAIYLREGLVYQFGIKSPDCYGFVQNNDGMEGSRFVSNCIQYSDTMQGGYWGSEGATLESGYDDPDGGNTALRYTTTDAYNYHSSYVGEFLAYENRFLLSMWIRLIDVGSATEIWMYDGESEAIDVLPSLVQNEWVRVSPDVVATEYEEPECGFGSNGVGTIFDVWHIMAENVTGRPPELENIPSEWTVKYIQEQDCHQTVNPFERNGLVITKKAGGPELLDPFNNWACLGEANSTWGDYIANNSPAIKFPIANFPQVHGGFYIEYQYIQPPTDDTGGVGNILLRTTSVDTETTDKVLHVFPDSVRTVYNGGSLEVATTLDAGWHKIGVVWDQDGRVGLCLDGVWTEAADFVSYTVSGTLISAKAKTWFRVSGYTLVNDTYDDAKSKIDYLMALTPVTN